VKIFKNVDRHQDICFKIKIAVLAERSNRESLHDNGVGIPFGYGIAYQQIVKWFARW